MCGITAIYNRQAAPVDSADLRAMCSVIRHRGPDAGGFALCDRGRVGLGHVRLSIIDPAGGTQPMVSTDGLVALTFNGELYDYQQHRAKLERRGRKFRTTSDTEVLLQLYLEHGRDCLPWLNGEFAFVIWDGRTQQLIAARDRFGVKPLFVYQSATELLLASEVKALFALPRVPRAFHPDYFISAYFGTFTPRTHLFENIWPLVPGHVLTVSGSAEPTVAPYWTPTFQTERMSREDAVAGVRERLTQAVQRRLTADVPVGSYLSGGLDSTLVCGLMARGGVRAQTYNIAFQNTIYDESALARQIAAHYRVPFATIDCSSEVLAENMVAAVRHIEIPLFNPNSIAKFALSRFVRDSGDKVCLTGEGSDEVFGGYPYFKQELLWRMLESPDPVVTARARALLRQFYTMERRSEGFLWNRDVQGRDQLPKYLERGNFHYSRMLTSRSFIPKVFTPEFLRTTSAANPLAYFEQTFPTDSLCGLDGFNATRRMTYEQLSQYIIPALGDRVEMAHSVECRTPFLDPDLAEFASRIPPELFVDLDQLQEKALLKQAFRDLLPDFMQREHKHPFLSPNWKRLAGTRFGRDLFGELLDPALVRRVGIFQPAFLRKAWWLWRILPERTTRWRRIDIALGLVASIHLLQREMLDVPQRGNREFPLHDHSP